ncbi:MAG: MarR family transcriptional regulator [Clostridiaceae bacterium]|nr:MarR family transcriptional regulator [Clostridiaceae bacterium]
MKPEFSAQTHMVWKIKNIHHMHSALMQEVLAGYGLHFGQPRILFTVDEMTGATQKELAERLQITPASLAMSLKRLQKAGFLEKDVNSKDLRCNKIRLTKKGRQAITRCHQKLAELDARMFGDFSPLELEQFQDFIRRIETNLGNAEVTEHDC